MSDNLESCVPTVRCCRARTPQVGIEKITLDGSRFGLTRESPKQFP